ncbi:MAG: tetratricopeptide repeat protein [Succinivibrionaceae bacterium]
MSNIVKNKKFLIAFSFILPIHFNIANAAYDAERNCEAKTVCKDKYETLITRKDYKGALPYAIQGCMLNESEQCMNAAFLYMRLNNNTLANKYFIKGCHLNNPNSCASIANNYLKGVGANSNHLEALTYFKKACDLQHADSCYNIANFHHNSHVVQINYNEHLDYLEKSCKYGSKVACVKLNSKNNKNNN